jgi:hypothetical protein
MGHISLALKLLLGFLCLTDLSIQSAEAVVAVSLEGSHVGFIG